MQGSGRRPRNAESSYGDQKVRLGPLFLPMPELIRLLFAIAVTLAAYAVLRHTDLGKALRASAEDSPVAASFGINQRRNSLLLAGTCAALAGLAGVCIALTASISPSQMYAWVGVVFATVMLGGLGSALGPLVAGVVIGVSEAVTMAVTSPSWAPLVSFTLLSSSCWRGPADRMKLRRAPVAVLSGGLLLCAVCPFSGSLRSMNPSCIWRCTGSCWPPPGTSCRDTRVIFRLGTARFSARVCTRRQRSRASFNGHSSGRCPSPPCWQRPSASAWAPWRFASAAYARTVRPLLTLAVTSAGDIVGTRPNRRRTRRVPERRAGAGAGPTATSRLYLMMLGGAAVATLLISWRSSLLASARLVRDPRRETRQVMGLPTYRWKLGALAISCALAAGRRHSRAVRSYITTAGTFNLTVPLRRSHEHPGRHAALPGPAVGALAITVAAVRVHRQQQRGARQRRGRVDPGNRHPLHARIVMRKFRAGQAAAPDTSGVIGAPLCMPPDQVRGRLLKSA